MTIPLSSEYVDFSKEVTDIESAIALNGTKQVYGDKRVNNDILVLKRKYFNNFLSFKASLTKEGFLARRSFKMLVEHAGLSNRIEFMLPESLDPKVNDFIQNLNTLPEEKKAEVVETILNPQSGAADSEGYWWMPSFLQWMVDTVKYYAGFETHQQEEVRDILTGQKDGVLSERKTE